jgi:hypothetical protein
MKIKAKFVAFPMKDGIREKVSGEVAFTITKADHSDVVMKARDMAAMEHNLRAVPIQIVAYEEVRHAA